tara:strand:+ start:1639 stop:1935 length:297 start_codon:yes stop_codon:yes gene_type:complete
MTYYNTVGLIDIELSNEWASVANQDQLILALFSRDNSGMTPFQAQNICTLYGRHWPITSIRRAINTLTKDGKLTKTSELRRGDYGKKCHVWRLNVENT